jgi:hypothetical protein
LAPILCATFPVDPSSDGGFAHSSIPIDISSNRRKSLRLLFVLWATQSKPRVVPDLHYNRSGTRIERWNKSSQPPGPSTYPSKADHSPAHLQDSQLVDLETAVPFNRVQSIQV